MAPPAKPEVCREDISIAYARESIVWLAQWTTDLEVPSRSLSSDMRGEWPRFVLRAVNHDYEREEAIGRCIEDEWPSSVARCYRESDSIESCMRQLPRGKCLAVEQATRMVDHDPGGRCGEPTRSFR